MTHPLPVPILSGRMIRRIDIPMRDGVKLATTVMLPHGDGPFPVVMVRTAYNRIGPTGGSDPFLKAGIAFVTQDCRGRYDSQGSFYPFLNEGLDGADTLAWLKTQPWCNGHVGMYGDSYLGGTQLYLVPHADESLVALNPRFIFTDGWRCGYYRDGVMSLALVWSWLCFECVTQTSDAALLPRYDVPKLLRELPLRTLDVKTGIEPVPYYRDYIDHWVRDAFWEQQDVEVFAEKFTMPTLLTGGWYDYYPGESLRLFDAMLKRAKSPEIAAKHRVLIGPWTHGMNPKSTLGDLDFGPTATAENDSTQRWLCALLKGAEPSTVLPKAVRVFVMGDNKWRDFDSWPPEGSTDRTWHLHAPGPANGLNGRGELRPKPAGPQKPDQYTYDPENPTPTLGGNHSVGPYNPGLYEHALPGPLDQRPIERRDDVLIYTSAPLEKDLTAIGPVSVHLFASSSAPDTDFVARLCDVHPDGRSINITEGVVRARFRDRQWDKPTLIEPGRVYELFIELFPTANCFKAGHRLRLQITSSNFPLWSRNHNTGSDPATDTRLTPAEQTIFHDADHPSRVTLTILE